MSGRRFCILFGLEGNEGGVDGASSTSLGAGVLGNGSISSVASLGEMSPAFPFLESFSLSAVRDNFLAVALNPFLKPMLNIRNSDL